MCAQTKPATATSTTTTTLDGMGNNTAPSANIESSSHPSSAASVVSFHNVAPPDRWFPWLVPAFVVTNVAAFAATMYVNDCPSTHTSDDGGLCVVPSLGRFSFEPLSINPLFGPSTDTLDLMGALNWKRVVWEGEWWRLFACVWLHAGVVHLLANMLSLLFIGIRLEQEFGFAKIGVLYVISGFGGSLMSAFSIQSKISVGASGALFGLLGAMLSELITNWSIYANKFAALITLIVIIGINMAVGFIPHVDSSAHIGGFITGFLLGFVLLIRPQFGWVNRKYIPPGYDMDHVKPKHKCYQQLLWATALVLLITGFTGGLFKLFHPVPVDV